MKDDRCEKKKLADDPAHAKTHTAFRQEMVRMRDEWPDHPSPVGPGPMERNAGSLRLLLHLLLSLIFMHSAAAAKDQDVAQDGQESSVGIRVVVWNILGARGFPLVPGGPIVFQEPSPLVIVAMADFLRKTKADLIVLQETPPEKDVRALGRLLGMQAAFFPAQAASGPEWPFGFPGAVLSRYPMKDATPWAGEGLGLARDLFQRHWGEVTIDIDRRPLRVASLHLCADWGGVNREHTRVAEIEAVLKSNCADILAGDFNMTPNSTPWRRLQQAGWRDAWLESQASGEGWTSDTRRRKRRIDYAWIEPGSSWICRKAEVLHGLQVEIDGQPLFLSDHLPLLVILDSQSGATD